MRMMDETWCGLLSCSHPACWKAQRRIRRGQARYTSPASSVSSASPRMLSELPTQKVHNILDEAFGSQSSLADSGFESTHSDSNLAPGQITSKANPLVEYLKWKRRQQTNAPLVPQATPSEPTVKTSNRRLQTLEVQEVFDLTELASEAWEQHFTAQPYYVWMPNPDRRPPVRSSVEEAEEGVLAPLPTRDVTEEMLPKTVDIKYPESPLLRNTKSSSYATRVGRYYRTGRANNGFVSLPDRKVASCGELRQVFGMEDKNVLSLLDLPPSILSDVLDQIEKGELITREKLGDLVRMASVSAPAVQNRSDSRVHPTPGPDLLHQRRAKIHVDNRDRNVRHPELHQTKLLFQMDETPGGLEATPAQGSVSLSRARPLPPIQTTLSPEDEQDRERASAVKSPSVQCVSIDAPKSRSGPPSRVRPFTYTRETQLDLMLAPISSPPMTQRSFTPRTDNDSASIHINVSTDRSTLDQEVLPVPEIKPLDSRSCTTSATMPQSACRRDLSPGSSNDGIPPGAIPPSTTPKTQGPGVPREEPAPLGTILESRGEETETPPSARLPMPPQLSHRSATVGRVTFEEGVVIGPPRRTSSPSAAAVAAVTAAAVALTAERSATIGPICRIDEDRSPSPSADWSQQASPDLWPVPAATLPGSAGSGLFERPCSSTPTTITIPIASARQAKSAPANRVPTTGKVVSERALATAPSGEGPAIEDETPLPPPPSPEPLPATESLESAERTDSLRVHSGGGPIMSPITESEDCDTHRSEREERVLREGNPILIVTPIHENPQGVPNDAEAQTS